MIEELISIAVIHFFFPTININLLFCGAVAYGIADMYIGRKYSFFANHNYRNAKRK
jgi:hypothetical protein